MSLLIPAPLGEPGSVSRPVHYKCMYCIDFCCFNEQNFQQDMQIALGPTNPATIALACSDQSKQWGGFFTYEWLVALGFGVEREKKPGSWVVQSGHVVSALGISTSEDLRFPICGRKHLPPAKCCCKSDTTDGRKF